MWRLSMQGAWAEYPWLQRLVFISISMGWGLINFYGTGVTSLTERATHALANAFSILPIVTCMFTPRQGTQNISIPGWRNTVGRFSLVGFCLALVVAIGSPYYLADDHWIAPAALTVALVLYATMFYCDLSYKRHPHLKLVSTGFVLGIGFSLVEAVRRM